MTTTAREPQNQIQFDEYHSDLNAFGPYTAFIHSRDPKHIGFLCARYKFVAKMLEGKRLVLEVGCGDGFGIPIVAQSVGCIHGVDAEPLLRDGLKQRLYRTACTFEIADITETVPMGGPFNAAYSLDVIEHIPIYREKLFFENVCKALHDDGVLVVGTPNFTAAKYASPESEEGHINLKTHSSLRDALGRYFENVFMFGMNDEVIHCGYGPMCHYLFALGVTPRR